MGRCGRVNALPIRAAVRGVSYGTVSTAAAFLSSVCIFAKSNSSTSQAFNLASKDNAITFMFAAFRNGSGSSHNASTDSASFEHIICADLLH